MKTQEEIILEAIKTQWEAIIILNKRIERLENN